MPTPYFQLSRALKSIFWYSYKAETYLVGCNKEAQVFEQRELTTNQNKKTPSVGSCRSDGLGSFPVQVEIWKDQKDWQVKEDSPENGNGEPSPLGGNTDLKGKFCLDKNGLAFTWDQDYHLGMMAPQ